MQDFKKIMEEAQKMQQRMGKAQEELAKEIVTGSSGGGLVTITCSCRHEVTGVKISQTLLNNVEMLQELIQAAMNDCTRKIEVVSKEKVSKLTAGMNIPADLIPKENDKS